jgi:fatty acid desaturase
MKQLLLIPALGAASLGLAIVGYAAVGFVLAVLLVGIVAIPVLFLFKKVAPKRFARMQHEIKPIW